MAAETYASPRPDYAMFNGHPYFGENALRLEADPDAPPQPGFLGHLVNDAALPPTDAEDIEYAQRYLVTTTNETNCHAVPFPSGMVAVAASKDLAAGEELLMSYTLGTMPDSCRDDGQAGAAEEDAHQRVRRDMKVASVKMEQLTAETLKIHAEAELLSRELLLDAAGDE